MSSTPNALPEGYTPTDPQFRRVILAMVAAGLASFNALYCTQALLPLFSETFHVSPATSSLTVSAITGMLALTIIPASILSERYGRKTIIICSTIAATVLGIALPFAPNITTLILLRAVQGLVIAGVPATAMTYLSEEVHPRHVAKVMGLYVAGTSIGGLSGRLIPSFVADIAQWKIALGTTVAFAILFAFVTAWALPSQRRFRPKELHIRSELSAMRRHWSDPCLAGMFVLAFLFMGSFVSLYNFFGYRLMEHFHLSESLTGSVFLLYLSGTWSATQTSSLISRVGRARALGLVVAAMLLGLIIMLSPELITTILGALLFTAGFFAAHSVAATWVGLAATSNRAEASSMYLFTYYLGSSIMGWVSGVIFHLYGWQMLIAWLCVATGAALVTVRFVAVQFAKRS